MLTTRRLGRRLILPHFHKLIARAALATTSMVLLLVLFLFIIVGNVRAERVFNYTDWFEWLYEPTSEELQRGIAVQPPSSWAHLARRERSARIVALGNLIYK